MFYSGVVDFQIKEYLKNQNFSSLYIGTCFFVQNIAKWLKIYVLTVDMWLVKWLECTWKWGHYDDEKWVSGLSPVASEKIKLEAKEYFVEQVRLERKTWLNFNTTVLSAQKFTANSYCMLLGYRCAVSWSRCSTDLRYFWDTQYVPRSLNIGPGC